MHSKCERLARCRLLDHRVGHIVICCITANEFIPFSAIRVYVLRMPAPKSPTNDGKRHPFYRSILTTGHLICPTVLSMNFCNLVAITFSNYLHCPFLDALRLNTNCTRLVRSSPNQTENCVLPLCASYIHLSIYYIYDTHI